MKQFTLNDFYDRIDYLTEKGTLKELLAFLEVQCVEGSERDIYKLANTGLMVFDVLRSEAKVRFEVFSPKEDSEYRVENFFLALFEDFRELLARLLELISEKYSPIGSLVYEKHFSKEYSEFVIKKSQEGYYTMAKSLADSLELSKNS